MPLLVLAVLAVVILIAAGRTGRAPLKFGRRIGRLLLALFAAVIAIAAALRGLWVVSLLFMAASTCLGADRFWRERRVVQDPMGADEACSILGVSRAASRAEIDAAYRRLMLRAHPDRGGTTGLATRLNAARDYLLKKI